MLNSWASTVQKSGIYIFIQRVWNRVSDVDLHVSAKLSPTRFIENPIYLVHEFIALVGSFEMLYFGRVIIKQFWKGPHLSTLEPMIFGLVENGPIGGETSKITTKFCFTEIDTFQSKLISREIRWIVSTKLLKLTTFMPVSIEFFAQKLITFVRFSSHFFFSLNIFAIFSIFLSVLEFFSFFSALISYDNKLTLSCQEK